MSLIFDRRIIRTTPGSWRTKVITTGVDPQISRYYKSSRIKQYLKEHRAPGMTPENGDLSSYMPWGNLGFFYNADGLGHSNDLIRIGRTDAIDEIVRFDGQEVMIEIAD